MSFILGVDAGNSKTIALVARRDGTIVGAGRGGCADIYNATSIEAALTEVDVAVEAALAKAGSRPGDLVASCFSMAGADWPEDYTFLHDAMTARGYGRTVRIVHDAIGGLKAGSPDGTGVSVVCGTGTAIGACAADGRFWHSSFWQESLDLDRWALRAVYRADLGIDPPTSLTQRALCQFGCDSVEEMLHRLTARDSVPASVDKMVAAVLDEADAGDAVARRIVAERGAMAGEYVLAAARRVGILRQPFTLVLSGGVLRHPTPLLAEAIVERVWRDAPSVRPTRSAFEPAAGALFLALDSAEIMMDEALIGRVRASMPQAHFFATL